MHRGDDKVPQRLRRLNSTESSYIEAKMSSDSDSDSDFNAPLKDPVPAADAAMSEEDSPGKRSRKGSEDSDDSSPNAAVKRKAADADRDRGSDASSAGSEEDEAAGSGDEKSSRAQKKLKKKKKGGDKSKQSKKQRLDASMRRLLDDEAEVSGGDSEGEVVQSTATHLLISVLACCLAAIGQCVRTACSTDDSRCMRCRFDHCPAVIGLVQS